MSDTEAATNTCARAGGWVTGSIAIYGASLVFVLTGIARTKAAASVLGPEALGVVAQLTQLVAGAVVLSAIGLGTGTRLVASDQSHDRESRAATARAMTRGVVAVAVLVSLIALAAAEPIANVVLGSREHAALLRVAIVALPAAVLVQVLIPLVQGFGDLRGLLWASVVTSLIGIAATVAAAACHNLALLVATIPVTSMTQLLALLALCPSARLVVRIGSGAVVPTLRRRALLVSFTSFAVAAAAAAGELTVRLVLVQHDGLGLVAHYQPLYLLDAQVFGLALGAVGSALLVTVNAELTGGRQLDPATLRRTLMQTTGLALVLGFVTQAGAAVYVPLVFDDSLIASTQHVPMVTAAEVLRTATWVLGAALLPLALTRWWLFSGLGTVAIQTLLGAILVEPLGLAGVVAGWIGGWSFGLVVTVLALRRRGVSVSGNALLTVLAGAVVMVVFGLLDEPPAWRLSYLPGLAAVACLSGYAGWSAHRRNAVRRSGASPEAERPAQSRSLTESRQRVAGGAR